MAAGSLPSAACWARSALVATFASVTLGSSNGFTPMLAQAIAVAISQRKISRPSASCRSTAMRTTGLPGALERRHGRVLPRVGRRGPHVDEEAIVAVALGGADGFEIDRDDPLAFLARRLRDQLLDPRTEARDVR